MRARGGVEVVVVTSSGVCEKPPHLSTYRRLSPTVFLTNTIRQNITELYTTLQIGLEVAVLPGSDILSEIV